jgi:transglutaminase-like putative cysteine protease
VRAPGAALALPLLLGLAPARADASDLVRVLALPGGAHARYALARSGVAGLAAPQHHVAGYDQRSRLRPDGSTEVAVVVTPGPLRSAAPWPREARADDLRWLARELSGEAGAAAAALAGEIALGSRTQLEVSERILTWVSLNVEHADDPAHDDGPASVASSRRGSCVGKSRLAVELLRVAGLPARTVHGLRVPRGALAGTRLGSAEFVLHRFVETWIDDLGWVPSDPGTSVHLVDPRLVVLAVEAGAYDPEQQRELRVTVLRPPGPLDVLVPVDAGATGRAVLLVRPGLHAEARP